MKKKIVTLAVSISFFIALVAFVQLSLGADVRWASAKADEIITEFEDSGRSEELCRELSEYWERRLRLWGAILPHDNLQEVTGEIRRLEIAVTSEDLEEARYAVSDLKGALARILHQNTLRFDHIL